MIRAVSILLVLLCTCAADLPEPEVPAQSIPEGHGACPKLPAPAGPVIKVQPSMARYLPQIVSNALPGTTILLADGTYTMGGGEADRRMIFAVPGVTMRSASGDRDKVIIDGHYWTHEIVYIAADDVTIADLTLKRAIDHLIHVVGGKATINGTLLYNLKLVDSGKQFVKVNSDGRDHYVDNGRLECSVLELTDKGRPHIARIGGGCYTGGIDAHSAWGWKVRYNTFKSIYCKNGSLAEHAIHFWSASRDTLVERNTIIDCARGIGFGLGLSGKKRAYADNPYPSVGYIGHIDGIIRNNVVHAGPAMTRYYDTGIGLEQARGARVYHNTVVSRPDFSSIDYRFPNTKVEIRNNLTYRITGRSGAGGTVDHNLQFAPSSLFVDVAGVDYHLKASASQAIDKGIAVDEAGLDIDGEPHTNGPPDLGADEK